MTSTFIDYVKSKTNQIIDSRCEQIVDNGVCFLQEFDKNSLLGEKIKESGKLQVFSFSGKAPSILLNSERFKVEPLTFRHGIQCP